MPSPPSRAALAAIAASVAALDRATKWVVQSRVSAFDTLPVIPEFFNIVHAENRGAAFSLFADSSSPFRAIFLVGLSLVAMGVVAAMLWNASKLDRATAFGLALIFGGACGNVFDRIVYGSVTDFLDFYIGSLHWPAFNVADSAIVVGSGLLLADLVRPWLRARTT
jgi:signal peptidase II